MEEEVVRKLMGSEEERWRGKDNEGRGGGTEGEGEEEVVDRDEMT